MLSRYFPVLVVSTWSSLAISASPSLEERGKNQLCLGSWTLMESIVVESSTVAKRQLKKFRTFQEPREIPPVFIEGPRNESKAGAFRDYMNMCTEHGAGIVASNPNFSNPQMNTTGDWSSKNRGKLTYRGDCIGTYQESITEEYFETAEFPSAPTQSIENKKTFSQLGLTKAQVASDSNSLIASLQQKIGTQVREALTPDGSIVITEIVKDYRVENMECSTADHIDAGDLVGKANYILEKMAEWEKNTSASCDNPEFKVIAGTLWHIRLVDLERNVLTPELRGAIDEKALLFPTCLLDGDQGPQFEVPLTDDFTIQGSEYEWIPGQEVELALNVMLSDSLTITYKADPAEFIYKIVSPNRRSNYLFTFNPDGSFTEEVRAHRFEYKPGTEAHTERVKALISEIDGYLVQLESGGPTPNTAPLQSFRDYLKRMMSR